MDIYFSSLSLSLTLFLIPSLSLLPSLTQDYMLARSNYDEDYIRNKTLYAENFALNVSSLALSHLQSISLPFDSSSLSIDALSFCAGFMTRNEYLTATGETQTPEDCDPGFVDAYAGHLASKNDMYAHSHDFVKFEVRESEI